MREPAEPSDDPLTLRERLLDVPWGVPRQVWYGRLAALIGLALWGTSVWLGKMTELPKALHLTVILFHEAGHVIFSLFGETLRVAGGTLAQLLMPLICATSMFRRSDNFGASVCLAWMAMSLMDASIYAYDAADPILPLIGGGTGADRFHDFIFLFDHFGQLDHARGWARLMNALGALGLYASLAWAGVLLYLQNEHRAD